MTRQRRFLLGSFLALFLAVIALVAGTFLSGRFVVAPGSGLAGPAIALGYGLISALAALAIGGLLAIFLPPKWLLRLAVPVILIGGALSGVLVWVYFQSRAATEAHLEAAYDRLNKFRVILVHRDAAAAPFRRMEIDWNVRRYQAVLTDGESCGAELTGREAVKMLEALRQVEGLQIKVAKPCAGKTGNVRREIDWFIPEAKPPDSSGSHLISEACAAAHPALNAPFEAALAIFANRDCQ